MNAPESKKQTPPSVVTPSVASPSVDSPSVSTPADGSSRQRARSLALAGALLFLVVLFYLLTIFKMGPGVINRPM